MDPYSSTLICSKTCILTFYTLVYSYDVSFLLYTYVMVRHSSNFPFSLNLSPP